MANQSEPLIIQELKKWKEELSKTGTITSDNIAELESHFLDEFDKLKALELSDEECILIAKKRIGGFEQLKTEFQKVNLWFTILQKMKPYLLGILIYLSFLPLSNILFFCFNLIAKLDTINYLQLSFIGLIFFLVGMLIISIFNYKKIGDRLKWSNNILVLIVFIFLFNVTEIFIHQYIIINYGIDKVAMNVFASFTCQAFATVFVLLSTLVLIAQENKSLKVISA